METCAKSISLGYSLAKANFKLRNEGSYLGVFWYLLNPLALFLTILFIRGAISNEVILYYPLYLIIGLTMVNFFTQLIRNSIGIVQGNAGFIKSMRLPMYSFVLSAVFQSIFSHGFELILIGSLFVYFHVSLVGLFWYLGIFTVYVIFTLGLCFLFTTLGAYAKDLGNVWAIVSQFLLFITPTFYAVHPGTHLYTGNMLNPLFYFMKSARDVAIYGVMPSWQMMCTIIVFAGMSLVIGLLVFRHFKNYFAELV